MTCAECGAEATYWLCSNACARAYLGRLGERPCAVCSFDATSRRLGTLETNRICRRCRAAPENADWFRGRKEEPDRFVENRNREHELLRLQQDDALPELTPRYRRIVQLVLEDERVAYVYIDKHGRRRGIRHRWQAHTIRRIAELEGCSKAEVEAVIKSIES